MFSYLHHLLCSFCVNGKSLPRFSVVSNQRTRRCLPDLYVCLSVYLHVYVMRLPYALRSLLIGRCHGLASLLVFNLLIVDRKLSCEPWAQVRMMRARVLLNNGKVELPCPYTITSTAAPHHRTTAPAAHGSCYNRKNGLWLNWV